MQSIIFLFVYAICVIMTYILIKKDLSIKYRRRIFFIITAICFVLLYIFLPKKVFFTPLILMIMLSYRLIENCYMEKMNIKSKFNYEIQELVQQKIRVAKEVDDLRLQQNILSNKLTKMRDLFTIVEEINNNIELEKIVKEFYRVLQTHTQNKIKYISLVKFDKKDIVDSIELPVSKGDIRMYYEQKYKDNVVIATVYTDRYRYDIIIEFATVLDKDVLSDISFFINETKSGFIRAILFKEVEELSRFDGLTGLYLRRYFYQRLNEEFLKSVRYNTEVSLIMIDLDFFKKVNDTYGHLAGDFVLKKIAEIILKIVANKGLSCRWGGEEFLILLPYTDKINATKIAEELRVTVENFDFIYEMTNIKLTISCGISSYPEDSREYNELIDLADKRLYKAKQSGRNKVVNS